MTVVLKRAFTDFLPFRLRPDPIRNDASGSLGFVRNPMESMASVGAHFTRIDGQVGKRRGWASEPRPILTVVVECCRSEVVDLGTFIPQGGGTWL